GVVVGQEQKAHEPAIGLRGLGMSKPKKQTPLRLARDGSPAPLFRHRLFEGIEIQALGVLFSECVVPALPDQDDKGSRRDRPVIVDGLGGVRAAKLPADLKVLKESAASGSPDVDLRAL